MTHHINIAWALKVNHDQLGARLEAYVETKSVVNTLRACLLRLSLPSKSTIPPEISQMIVDKLRDASYLPKILKWHRRRRCVQDECETLDHVDMDVLADHKIDDPDDVDELFWEERMLKHDSRVEKYLHKVNPPKSQNSMRGFALCKAVSYACRTFVYLLRS